VSIEKSVLKSTEDVSGVVDTNLLLRIISSIGVKVEMIAWGISLLCVMSVIVLSTMGSGNTGDIIAEGRRWYEFLQSWKGVRVLDGKKF
jgi:hypothetical protein